jgi:hypothetical protein
MTSHTSGCKAFNASKTYCEDAAKRNEPGDQIAILVVRGFKTETDEHPPEAMI